MSPTLDVIWLPTEPILSEDPAFTVVIDVLRATTSISTAIAAGAVRVVPATTTDEARERAAETGALLCGERRGEPPPGFDLGNSPRGFTSDFVHGRELVFTTTNGTRAMRTAAAAHEAAGVGGVLLACFRNSAAVTDTLLSGRPRPNPSTSGDIVIMCAGRGGRVSMDDAWCAGHLVGKLAGPGGFGLTDGARSALELAVRLGRPSAAELATMAAGRALTRIGLEADLAVCARLDDLEVAPVWVDGAFVKGGEEEGT